MAEERLAAELEVLEAIYSNFLTIESENRIIIDFGFCQLDSVVLSLEFPCEYPVTAAARVRSLSHPHWKKSVKENVKEQLQVISNELIGQESVLSLVQELQDILLNIDTNTSAVDEPLLSREIDVSIQANSLGEVTCERCWVWVHHITDTNRARAIVREAESLSLGGFLKRGYPGVVVVEGYNCQEFVTWVKGNKSRPGGFGRNWGHHVRGQVQTEERKLPNMFRETENLKTLGEECRKYDVESEFLEFVLQHKK